MKYRNRIQATEYLNGRGIPCGKGSLARMAITGEGPQFRYHGRRPLYTDEDLDAWIEIRLSDPVTQAVPFRPSKPIRQDPKLGPPTRKARQRQRRKAAAGQPDLFGSSTPA